MPNKASNEDIINRANREHIAAEEMDILVSSSHNQTGQLERDVNKLRNKLEQIEDQLYNQ
jgi:hypothetical protein